MNAYKITLTFAESFGSEPLNYRFCVCLNKGVFRYFFVYVDQPDMIID